MWTYHARADLRAIISFAQTGSTCYRFLKKFMATAPDRIMEENRIISTRFPGPAEMWNRVCGCRLFSIIIFCSIIMFFHDSTAYNKHLQSPSHIPLFWYVLIVLWCFVQMLFATKSSVILLGPCDPVRCWISIHFQYVLHSSNNFLSSRGIFSIVRTQLK